MPSSPAVSAAILPHGSTGFFYNAETIIPLMRGCLSKCARAFASHCSLVSESTKPESHFSSASFLLFTYVSRSTASKSFHAATRHSFTANRHLGEYFFFASSSDVMTL